MCHYKKIHHTEHGYVVRCNDCRHFHVGFGTTVLAFSYDQFYDFVRTVNEYYEANRYSFPHHQKVIQIPTVARSITLVYSLAELERLSDLLHETSNKLDKEKLFVFNEN